MARARVALLACQHAQLWSHACGAWMAQCASLIAPYALVTPQGFVGAADNRTRGALAVGYW